MKLTNAFTAPKEFRDLTLRWMLENGGMAPKAWTVDMDSYTKLWDGLTPEARRPLSEQPYDGVMRLFVPGVGMAELSMEGPWHVGDEPAEDYRARVWANHESRAE